MAGEWIKVRTNLWSDPRVSQLCDLTDEGKATIIGALYWLWAAADEHTEDGHMPGLSAKGIDRDTGIKGFGAALLSIGWLLDADAGVTLTRFSEHNGASAKNRAQTAKRVANHKGNAKVTPAPLPNEEEGVSQPLPRVREELDKELKTKANTNTKAPAAPSFDAKSELIALGVATQTATDFLQNRKKGKFTQTALNGIISEAEKAGYSLESALALACKRGWQSFEAVWVLKDERGLPPGGYQTANDKAKTLADRLTGKTRNEQHNQFDFIDLNPVPP